MPAIDASSVSVSVGASGSADASVRPPRAGAPGVRCSATARDAGSGHSAYGVGLVGLHTRLTTAPSAIFWPAAVVIVDASTRCVEFGMSVIRRVVLVVVLSALVCGIVSVKPIRNGLVFVTISVAVFD